MDDHRDRHTHRRAGLLAGALFLVLALAVTGATLLATIAASPAKADLFSQGSASAPVTIEIWADFQCPYCARTAHAIEPALIRDLVETGQARIVFHAIAFLGPESVDAAVAARCAGVQGRFWAYHDLLYAFQAGENQGGFSRDILLSMAQFTGLDMAAFTTCLNDPATSAAVQADTVRGGSLGIESTPTYRIVGSGQPIVLAGFRDIRTLESAVAQAANPGDSRASAPVPAASTAPSAEPSSPGPSGPSVSAAPTGSAAPLGSPAPSGSAAPSGSPAL